MLENGTAEFRNDEEAAAARRSLRACSSIPGVTGVYFGYDFITVTKDGAEWQHLKPAILGSIMEHFMSGQPIMGGSARAEDTSTQDDEFFERRRRDHRRDDQGTAGNPRASGRRPGWRRHHLPAASATAPCSST